MTTSKQTNNPLSAENCNRRMALQHEDHTKTTAERDKLRAVNAVLLAALKDLLFVVIETTNRGHGAAARKAHAAIRKAEGRS